MKILEQIKEKAKIANGTIILPEANMDERVMKAGEIILENGLSNIIVFGKESEFSKTFKCDKCQIIDIETSLFKDSFATQLYKLRKAKGLTLEKAQELIKEPIYFAMMLLKNNYADGVVAGAKYTTADTLRPALQIIKTKPGKGLVTGCMLMLKENKEPLVFADISVIENPSAEQLAEIAISNAEFVEQLLGVEPRVAMLSYSTKGSAKSEMTDKVIKATQIAQNLCNYKIDGEMQVDAALDDSVATKKGVNKEVGGKANVLIFPDLNAGNIGYKLVARLGDYTAVGPIILNFNKPVNDLSRGCTIEEVVITACITKLMK